MHPHELRVENFSGYPPQAAALAASHLTIFQKTPLALLPIILRQVIDYDWRFPAEQRALRAQLDYLDGLSPAAFTDLMNPFSGLRLPPELDSIDWVNQPQRFIEQFSAILWSTLQMNDYREAVLKYEQKLSGALVQESPAIPRFTIAIVGQGVERSTFDLFRPLRQHGVLFTAVDPKEGLRTLLDFVNTRAEQNPSNYAHWYIEGAQAESNCGSEQGVTVASYTEVAAAALRELTLTNRFIQQSGKSAGPELARSYMASLGPKDLDLAASTSDAALLHFKVSLLTEGAGTQIFSTTFVQWAAREVLRRAHPLTVLARFAPRQQMAPMNELLKRDPLTQPTDPEGSLIDADMGAYYTWINQGRLAGADQSRFLAWFEGHNVALAIAPTLPRGTVSTQPASIQIILNWMS